MTYERMIAVARFERDKSVQHYLIAKRRHRGVVDARARMREALNLFIRVQARRISGSDVERLRAIELAALPRVKDVRKHLREVLA